MIQSQSKAMKLLMFFGKSTFILISFSLLFFLSFGKAHADPYYKSTTWTSPDTAYYDSTNMTNVFDFKGSFTFGFGAYHRVNGTDISITGNTGKDASGNTIYKGDTIVFKSLQGSNPGFALYPDSNHFGYAAAYNYNSSLINTIGVLGQYSRSGYWGSNDQGCSVPTAETGSFDTIGLERTLYTNFAVNSPTNFSESSLVNLTYVSPHVYTVTNTGTISANISFASTPAALYSEMLYHNTLIGSVDRCTGGKVQDFTYSANFSGASGFLNTAVATPVPSLSAALTAVPSAVNTATSTKLTGSSVSQNQTGNYNFSFWWNCPNYATATAKDYTSVSKVCGTLTNDSTTVTGFKKDNQTSTGWAVDHIYTSAGTYTPVYVVERGGLADYASATVTVDAILTPTVNLTANGNTGTITIPYNTAATLAWSSTNNPTSCTASGSWSGAKSVSGSQSTGALTSSKSYSLYCTNSSGSSPTATVNVNVGSPPPPFTMSANLHSDLSSYSVGQNVYLTASAGNLDSVTSSYGDWFNYYYWEDCSNGPTTTNLSLANYTASTLKDWYSSANFCNKQPEYHIYNGDGINYWNMTTNNLAPYTYSTAGTKHPFVFIYNSNTGATVQAPAVTVSSAPGPTIDLRANNHSGSTTISYNTAANLTWTTSNATACTVSGSWTGSRATSNTTGESTGNLTSSRSYSMSCTGPGGNANANVNVNVGASVTPSVSLMEIDSSNPSNQKTNTDDAGNAPAITIPYGGSVILNWSQSNATTCYTAGSPTESNWNWNTSSPASSGSSTISNITQAHTFTLFCNYNWEKFTSAQVILYVTPPQTLTVGITAAPSTGPAPMNVNITATPTSTGFTSETYNYYFWMDCSVAPGYVSGVMKCGGQLPFAANINTSNSSASHTATYNAGTYNPRVYIERGTKSSTASTSVNYTASATTLSATLSAIPSTGFMPLSTILTANRDSASTATGSISYSFWWNCPDSAITSGAKNSVSNVSHFCGPLTDLDVNDAGYKANAQSFTVTSISTPANPATVYVSANMYTARLIIEQGTATPHVTTIPIIVAPAGNPSSVRVDVNVNWNERGIQKSVDYYSILENLK
ncbi:TPA: hypothetical protein DD449_02140 [Candidatus Berkelbacteria bacterium]|uniref:Uncharacterized protein n=1 Tax=Berkelbacteria bacterium GW2011_GWE1_39_12 TaxID=1618337 RepID=A0A0G4B4F8_9BACT|nr:MAG: exported protein of unknown function [Berkelbacteria bacterium GW2011_GWE1_39_12]HBO60459.1 hypothetical protein [Candidatus Berkelbacteria bacterium]